MAQTPSILRSIAVLHLYTRCRSEITTLQRVAGPAATLLELSTAALFVGGLVARLSG